MKIDPDPSIINVAIIGAGYMACEHIKAFSDISNVRIAGIHSRTVTKAREVAEEFEIPLVANSISTLFEQTRAGILVIAVSELSVHEVVKEAFKYSWYCLIEKPAGIDFAEALEIQKLADRLDATAYVGLNRRHYSSTRAVLEELKGVKDQRLIHVYDQENPAVQLAGGRPKKVVQNWMYANSMHVIDYLQMFGRGEITSVESIIHWKPDVPRFVMAKISYSSGDIGIYEAVWNGPGPWAVTVTTQQKRWELRPLEQASVQRYQSRNLDALPLHSWDTQFKAGLRLQAEEMLNALNGLPHSLPTLENGLETMRLVKEIYEI